MYGDIRSIVCDRQEKREKRKLQQESECFFVWVLTLYQFIIEFFSDVQVNLILTLPGEEELKSVTSKVIISVLSFVTGTIETNKNPVNWKQLRTWYIIIMLKKQSLKTTMPNKHSNPLLFKLWCVFKEWKGKIFRNIVAIRWASQIFHNSVTSALCFPTCNRKELFLCGPFINLQLGCQRYDTFIFFFILFIILYVMLISNFIIIEKSAEVQPSFRTTYGEFAPQLLS